MKLYKDEIAQKWTLEIEIVQRWNCTKMKLCKKMKLYKDEIAQRWTMEIVKLMKLYKDEIVQKLNCTKMKLHNDEIVQRCNCAKMKLCKEQKWKFLVCKLEMCKARLCKTRSIFVPVWSVQGKCVICKVQAWAAPQLILVKSCSHSTGKDVLHSESK